MKMMASSRPCLLSTLALAMTLMTAEAAHGQSGKKAPGNDGSRGALLYQTHCIACHNEKVHWREERLARDWGSLNYQVQRWQRNSGLSWEEQDVRAVARYLNQLYYEFPAEQSGTLSKEGPR